MKLNFEKYQGAGNDFVILGPQALELSTKQIAFITDRRFGIGADGMIILLDSKLHDFEMLYYNSDGKLGSLCGNGARCAVSCFLSTNTDTDKVEFLAADGLHSAYQDQDKPQIINLQMGSVNKIQKTNHGLYLNTGSPHLICIENQIGEIDVNFKGANLRNHLDYTVYNGVNVNFVELLTENSFRIRTFERGVESETLACGTGITAAAIGLHFSGKTNAHSLRAYASGGDLSVRFEPGLAHNYNNIWLSGPAIKVFEGFINI